MSMFRQLQLAAHPDLGLGMRAKDRNVGNAADREGEHDVSPKAALIVLDRS